MREEGGNKRFIHPYRSCNNKPKTMIAKGSGIDFMFLAPPHLATESATDKYSIQISGTEVAR